LFPPTAPVAVVDSKVAAIGGKLELNVVAGAVLTAREQIERDLAYRLPGSGRPLGYIVLSRAQAQSLIDERKE